MNHHMDYMDTLRAEFPEVYDRYEDRLEAMLRDAKVLQFVINGIGPDTPQEDAKIIIAKLEDYRVRIDDMMEDIALTIRELG